MGIVAIFIPKVRESKYKEQKIKQLEEQYNQTRDKVNELRQKQQRLKSDPEYIGQIAREKLGKVKPGETIFRFDLQETNENNQY
jgi:cell division protein FtsB